MAGWVSPFSALNGRPPNPVLVWRLLMTFFFFVGCAGYGATTLPALTESITIEKNATRAKYEVKRLVQALDGIAETIVYRD
jgi:hypothetical protein